MSTEVWQTRRNITEKLTGVTTTSTNTIITSKMAKTKMMMALTTAAG